MIIAIIIFMTLVDSVFGALLYASGFGDGLSLSIIYLKYIVFFSMFCAYLWSVFVKANIIKHELFGLIYLAMSITLSLIIGALYPDSNALTRAYTYYFPVIIYFAGAWWGAQRGNSLATLVYRYAVMYVALNGIFGLQYYIFGGEYIWRDWLAYANFVAEVKGFSDGIIDGLPGNFYYDPYGSKIPRFVGSMGDPLAAAYAGISAVIALVAIRPRAWKFFSTVIAVMVVATLTRGVLVGAIISFFIFILFRHRAFSLILLGGVFTTVIAVTLSEEIFQFMGDSSTAGHLESINSISSYLSLTSIVFGSLGSGKVPFFEPGLFNIAFTFGIIPTTLFLVFVRGIYVQIGAAPDLSRYLSLIIIIGLMTLMVISASFLAVTSSWFAWFAFGVFMSKNNLRQSWQGSTNNESISVLQRLNNQTSSGIRKRYG